MFSDSDLQELRDAARLAMPSTARLLRSEETTDPLGNTIPGEAVEVGSSICAITTNLSQSALVGDQGRTTADAVVILPGDTALAPLPTDQLEVDGQVYELQGWADKSGRWGITRRVLVSRLQ